MSEKIGRNSSVYSEEKTKLKIICGIFCLSYLIDFLYNYFVISSFCDNQCFNWTEMKKDKPNCNYLWFILLQEMYFIVDPLPIIVLLSVHYTNFKLRVPRAVQAPTKQQHLNDEGMDFTEFNRNEDNPHTASVANSAVHSALIFDSYHIQS